MIDIVSQDYKNLRQGLGEKKVILKHVKKLTFTNYYSIRVNFPNAIFGVVLL